MSISFTSIERVTHDESRIRDAKYWAERSSAERVIAGLALAKKNLFLEIKMSQRSEQVSLFAAFLDAGVEYAVVGSVDVNVYGLVSYLQVGRIG